MLRNALIHRQLRAGQLPLIRGNERNTEMLLSEELKGTSSPSHHLLANRALIRARLKHLALVMEDVRELKSLQIQPSPIGYIAMAAALLGQGDREGALHTFDFAFHDCELQDIRLLLLLKSILVFESGNQEEAIARVEHLATRASNDSDDDAIHLYTQARPWSYVFGWSFKGLDIAAQQRICEILYAEQRTAEAVETFLSVARTSEEEIQGNHAIVDWIADFTKKCATTLERVGDEAFRSVNYDDAITQCSAALSLGSPSPTGLLIKRSRARAAKGLWEDALRDANKAVKAEPTYPWGHEAEHMALHGAKRPTTLQLSVCTFCTSLTSTNDDFTVLRKNYFSPPEIIATIDPIIRETLKSSPLVLIDVTTGWLCDGPERKRIFEAGLFFKDLVSSMTRELDNERILQVVTRFFGYVVFSHVWQGNEPLFPEVNAAQSIWNLPETPLNEKLGNFCKEVHGLGYNWAWSDTCCIDKTTSSILNQSLTSMHKWYADSAATLVFLAGLAHPPELGDRDEHGLCKNFSHPKSSFSMIPKWKPYLGDTGANQKESPEIMQELADAIQIHRGTFVTFSPDDLAVREKLRLASTRNATVEEDVAYSLISIFKSDIRPLYGEGADALGHLLEEIVARSGEVDVLAWSGKPSSYNSSKLLTILHRLKGKKWKLASQSYWGKLTQQEALSIYRHVGALPPARFATRRLHLPCIVFPVRRPGIQEIRRGNGKLYRARVSGLGNVEFTTADDLPLQEPQKFVFVHPWIRHIRGPSSGIAWGDGSDSDTDSDSGSSHNAGLGAVAPLHVAPMPKVGSYARALQMIARLGQPFNALLLVQQPNGEYKRVAAENEIIVSGLGTDITSNNIRAKVLEIL
ncbi:hypothetical protein F5141DRAFT_1070226 [Pisolithus sp. B1]|nr:hypothetical protein F5141DRAFT_1070226 [Pisolithus sp. B1]